MGVANVIVLPTHNDAGPVIGVVVSIRKLLATVSQPFEKLRIHGPTLKEYGTTVHESENGYK
jgi:hypothetical protein